MNRIQELFHQAAIVPPSERARWLRDNCTQSVDADLIRSLLEHDDKASDLFDAGLTLSLLGEVGLTAKDGQLLARCAHCDCSINIAESDANHNSKCDQCGESFYVLPEHDDAEFPATVSHFELIEQIGHGAFASVFKAIDMELDRVVAIKLPRNNSHSRDDTEMFLREARTAAKLQHPHIVSVHEVGSEDGTVFIVSDLVSGISLAERLEQGLTPLRESVELLITIARALHYAHSNGVVHRDLKPSNIILDDEGQPYLTDFGIAKVELANATITSEGQVLGTPAYMSPEQARGERDLDHRTDIYALGVLLFELMTGELPFRGHSRLVMHQLITEDAPSPRKYSPHVPKDLETICLKCLGKSATQRYQLADELAEDLSRWLAHQPILARPLGRLQRGWRFCIRNPLVAGLSSLLLVSLVCGIVVASILALQSEQRASELASTLALKEQLVDEKESLIKQLESSNLAAVTRSRETESVLEFFRNKVLATNRPEGVDGGLGIETTITDAISAAEPTIEYQFRNQPQAEAAIRQTIAENYLSHGRYRDAKNQAIRCYALRSEHLGENDPQTIASSVLLTRARLAVGEFKDSLALGKKTRSRAQSHLGENHITTLDACNAVAAAFESLGQINESRSLLESTAERLEKELGSGHKKTLSARDSLARAFLRMGRVHESVELHESVVGIAIRSLGPDHASTLQYQHSLAKSYATAGRTIEAIDLFAKTLELRKRQLGAEHLDTLSTITSLATVQENAGRIADATETLLRAKETLTLNLGEDHPRTLSVAARLASAIANRGQLSDAIRSMERIVALAESRLGSHHPDTCRWKNELADMLARVGRVNEAVPLRTPLLKIEVADCRLRGDSLDLADTLILYSSNLIQNHRYHEAFDACVEAMHIYEGTALESWKYFHAKTVLGRIHLNLKEYEKAESHLTTGYDYLLANIRSLPTYSVDFGQLIGHITVLYEAKGDREKSKEWRRRQAEFTVAFEKSQLLREKASNAADEGNLADAMSLYERAESLPWQRSVHRPARVYARALQWDEALESFKNAFPFDSSWQELCLLYRMGRYDDFRAGRKIVLDDYTTIDKKFQYQLDLSAALMLPIDDSMEIPVRFLSAVNQNQQSDAQSLALVGKAMYRLGEFLPWYESLPPNSPLRNGHGIRFAAAQFVRDPTAKNRRSLESEIVENRRRSVELVYANLEGQYWPDYIETMAWIHEAEQVLGNDMIDQTWPDENIDLIAVGARVLELRRQSSVAVNAGQLDKAIAAHEEIATILDGRADAELVNLYARTLDWDNALRVSIGDASALAYRTALIQYQLGQKRECRAFVNALLIDQQQTSYPSHACHHARAAILLPLDESVRSEISRLAEANADPTVDKLWRKILVGPLRYRLGDFSDWYDSLSPESPFHDGEGHCNALLVALADFQRNPSKDSSETVLSEVARIESRMQRLIEKRDLGPNWADHIWRSALASEAKREVTKYDIGQRNSDSQ